MTVWWVAVEAVGRPGAENMAIDEALLMDADRTGRAYLRLYRWDPPCLSLGRNETALARYDRAAIERLGLAVVRRPTGGRAVWHEHEVTYAVAAPASGFGSLRNAYRSIHERLAAALRTLGVEATLAPDRPTARCVLQGPPAASFRDRSGTCFAAAAGGELVVDGRKLVGSAQVRHGTAFLQHGSILLDGTQEVVGAVSRRPSAKSRETTLSAVLGRPVSFEEVVGAIAATWGDEPTRSAPVRPGPSPSAFSNPSWTWRR